ncbi:MAG: hypothetical protein KatS3mg014_2289 [Actinomycetota bacterium]|nr:MAG: hypothetical protein KatS3mg014_2289 [Actinomycetota bacterium]
MYGTVARMKVKRENLEALQRELGAEDYPGIPGFRSSHLLIPDEWNDEVIISVFFDDEASYRRNADDPAMHERYLRYRALLEADPEWTDGEWRSFEA